MENFELNNLEWGKKLCREQCGRSAAVRMWPVAAAAAALLAATSYSTG